MTGSKRVIMGPADERPEDMQELAELANAGVLRPVIDRRYEFARMAEVPRDNQGETQRQSG